jgi:hypothetical protein
MPAPRRSALAALAALCLLPRSSPAALSAGPACPVNTSFFAPLTCPDGYACCAMPATLVCADAAPPCTSCPMCCHDGLNATQCAQCDATLCKGQRTIGDQGCNTTHPLTPVPYVESCCARGVPLPASRALPNCLLIGDSVMEGQASLVAQLTKDVCQTQFWGGVGINAPVEQACWGTHRASIDGDVIAWDLILFNEGLHSLWPRTNVSDASGAAFAQALANWTAVLALPWNGVTPTLVYSTMTPMMEAHYCNPPGPPQSTVEDLNSLAIATVKAAGVARILDAYSVITRVCGDLYVNCSLCDDEAQYACPAYREMGGQCMFHYVAEGWELLANATAGAIRGALAETRPHRK